MMSGLVGKQQEQVTLSRSTKNNSQQNQLFQVKIKNQNICTDRQQNKRLNKSRKIIKIQQFLFASFLIGTAILLLVLAPLFKEQQIKLSHLLQNAQLYNQKNDQYHFTLKEYRFIHNRMAQNIIRPQKINQNKIGLLEIGNQAIKLSESIQQQFQFGKLVFSATLSPNLTIDQAEYYRLNKYYNLEKTRDQRSICIISPFRNLLKYGVENASLHLYLQTINDQNYSNYHVYMIDDASIDNSTQTILGQLKKYPRLNNRITILRNTKIEGALANRDTTTRQHCKSGDIIMDVDGDDALIGKQTLKLFNAFYSNPEAWYVYTNFIQITAEVNEGSAHLKYSLDLKKAQKGICKPILDKVLLNNTYRTEFNYWSTSELRTYLRDLYIKIPINYLIQKGTNRYYLEASDRFVMYSLVQLAGKNHTFYYEQYNYFYFRANAAAQPKVVTTINPCFFNILFYTQAQSRALTPLKNLKSLNSTPQLTQSYQLPYEVWGFLAYRQYLLMRCLLKRQSSHQS